MTSSTGRRGPDAMTRPRRNYSSWMRALMWSRCAHCDQRIEEGQWQGLAEVPGVGTRWVHEACALRLGPAGEPQRPVHDRGIPPDTLAEPVGDVEPAPLRVLVLGSPSWPRERAVEVRDALAAVARGHARVVLIHEARTAAETGRLAGVDAWAELTAQRLGLEVEHHPTHSRRDGDNDREHTALAASAADVVVAFPLDDDPATAEAITRAEAAGFAVLTHQPPKTL